VENGPKVLSGNLVLHLGLGLAISRSIVEAHGGRLWCKAKADGSETFSFLLPT
jgi:signal transduction histidine kinase